MSHDVSHDVMAHEGVEPEDVHVGPVLRVTFVTALFVLLLVFVGYEVGQHAFRAGVAEATAMTGYPALRSATEAGLAKLDQYGVVNADEDRYRIPIDRAIDLMVNEAAAADVAGSPELRLTR